MNPLAQIGKFMMIAGFVMVLLGLLLLLGEKIPWFGRLPGDLLLKGKNGTFYFPLATCVIVSAVLSLLLHLFGKK